MHQLTRITFSILCASVACFAATAFAQTKEAGFTSLFDGRTFTGWEHSGNWVVEGGAFYRKEKGGSLTYTAATVPDDFELRFEWKVSKGCNSGVYYRPGQVEYQILDNVHSPYGENARQAAASIFFCMAPSKDATKPFGEWNTGGILCKGTVIEHWLNGERVLSFDYADPKWTDYVKLLGIRGGDLTGRGGRLWLQDHGQDVWYRALRWREIPTDERLTPDPAFKPLPVTGAALAKEQGRVKRMLDARKKPAKEPTNATEAAAKKAKAEAALDVKYQVWVKTLTPAGQAWERVLQSELGGFYLPIHKRQKVAGQSNAWDFVEDDPALPRVLLIGDSVSRAYTQTVRNELAGKANVHRAPANCGPTATGLKKIDVWLGDGKWDLIHFNFGIHDRNTPIADYKQRLEQLIARMKQTDATLIWANTTPIPDLPKKKYTAASIVQRNAAAEAVMTKHKVAINDLFGAITPRLVELQNPDDVHFNGAGNTFLGQHVARFLEPRLKRRFDFSVRASEIDPRAKEHPEIGFVFADAEGKPQDLQHAVVDTRAASRGRLVIWLMGHNQGLFERIGAFGLHGIQPHYANRWFSKIDATARDDGTTLGKIRLEAATGEDHSPLVTIPNPDGMAERSVQFVKWLAKENPEGKWDQFLTDDQSDLCWDKVIMSGISHGSTTAARFAKHQKVARVVMFSGPRDQFESWQGFPSATPANRYFGFTHVLDGGWTGDHYCRSWQMLGLAVFGSIVKVDEVAAPFDNSRRLITSSDVDNNPRRAHTTVVPGGSAVKNDQGDYIHEAVWRYLFTHPVDHVGKPVQPDPNCRINQRR